MTETKPTPTILSGHCGIRRHSQCLGRYAGYDCRCECHTVPPEPEPVALHHCPSCTCQGPRP